MNPTKKYKVTSTDFDIVYSCLISEFTRDENKSYYLTEKFQSCEIWEETGMPKGRVKDVIGRMIKNGFAENLSKQRKGLGSYYKLKLKKPKVVETIRVYKF